MLNSSSSSEKISDKAQEFRDGVQNSDNFLDSCDGGDAGSPIAPSVWLLGIEPGWSLSDQARDDEKIETPTVGLKEYSIDLQLKWPFNRNAFKFLAALNDRSPSDYIDFARSKRPFEKGATGYFKGNLFPEAFNNIHSWDDQAVSTTGFASKAQYQAWLREVRFPIVRSWIEKCRPRLVIGAGLTHLHDFMAVTGTNDVPEPHRFEVNGHAKRVYLATSGAVSVAVIPHLSGGSHGLNSDEAISRAAQFIRIKLASMDIDP